MRQLQRLRLPPFWAFFRIIGCRVDKTLPRVFYSCIPFSHFLHFFHFPSFTSPPPCGPGWSHCAFIPFFVLPGSLIPAFTLPESQASFLLSHFIFLFSHLSGYHQSSAILGRPTASRHTPISDRAPVLAARVGSLWRYSQRPGSFSSWTVRARISNSTR